MRDYEELVNLLKICPDYCNGCTNCPHEHDLGCRTTMMAEAADAIEELLGKPNGKWVPATELPPKGETYGDTTFSVDVLGTEAFTYRRAYYNFRAKVWLDGNTEEEWPSITHWMHLPKPPKEDGNA